MKKMILFLCLVCTATVASATDLPGPDAELINNAGIPLYDKAVFAYGNSSVGFRFATSDSPETVRQWYMEQLSGWTVFDQFGSWLIYNGKPGLGMGEVMSKDQVSVQVNDKLPEWHSLDKSMTTEIVIMIFQ